MEREGVSTLSIRSFLRDLRVLFVLKYFCALCVLKMFGKFLSAVICFAFNSCISPQEC